MHPTVSSKLPRIYSVFATTTDRTHAALTPLTTILWCSMNITPILILVGQRDEWSTPRRSHITKHAEEAGAILYYVGEHPHLQDTHVLQIVRLGAEVLPIRKNSDSKGVEREDSYVILTDSDILPLDPAFFSIKLIPYDSNLAIF